MHGNSELLFNQQNRDSAVAQFPQKLTYELNNFGGQTLGGLVDDDQFGVAHQAAAQGQHLLLTTRKHTGLGMLALTQTRKQVVHVFKIPAALGFIALQAEQEVLVNR